MSPLHKLKSMPLFSLITVTLLFSTLVASQVGPFHLQLQGATGYAFDNHTVSLRPIPGSNNATAVVVDNSASPELTTRSHGSVNSGAKLPSLDSSTFQPLGPIGGLVPASSIGKLSRRQFIFQKVADAGNGAKGKAFKKSVGGFYIDAIPGRMAYYLFHTTRPEIVNGWIVCPSADGGNFGELFYYEYTGNQPKAPGCYYVGLAVVSAKS